MVGQYSGVYKFCCEDISLIENYDKAINDNTQVWQCHHRLETHYENGERRINEPDLTAEELESKGLYYNRPAKELIFLTNQEHAIMHQKTRDERLDDNAESKRIQSIHSFWNSEASAELREKKREYLKSNNPGRVKSPEFIEKMRVSHLRENLSDETLKRMSEASKNRERNPHSEETISKMSDKAKLRWLDESYREKQIISHLGHIHNDEERAYISKRVKESMTPEVRKKISDSAKGRVHTQEQRKKQSERMKGRKFSSETIQRMSDARKKYWEDKKKKI